MFVKPKGKVEVSFPVSLKQYDSETKETTHERDKNLLLFIFFVYLLGIFSNFFVKGVS